MSYFTTELAVRALREGSPILCFDLSHLTFTSGNGKDQLGDSSADFIATNQFFQDISGLRDVSWYSPVGETVEFVLVLTTA